MIPAGEDTVPMVSGVLMLMVAPWFGKDGLWGVILGLPMLVLGLAWPYLGLT